MADRFPYSTTDIQVTDRDIQFECRHCANILIVDRDGAGLELACPHCGEAVVVPPYEQRDNRDKSRDADERAAAAQAAAAAAESKARETQKLDFSGESEQQLRKRLESLERMLKENDSQRMETQGHINRMTIDLHRQNLALERLKRRQEELEAERSALTEAIAAS